MDYRDFEKGAQKKHDGSYWWNLPLSKMHEGVMATARQLAERQAERFQGNLRCARLYGNFDMVGWGVADYSRSASATPVSRANRISWNLISSCVDTLCAKIAKTTPRPSPQTNNGNWKQHLAAKKLDYFIRGWFYETKMHREGAKVFRDAMILDVAPLKIYRDCHTGRVLAERAFGPELVWDEAEAKYGSPRQLFHMRSMPREVLRGLFLKDVKGAAYTTMERAISKARAPQGLYASAQESGDMVEVVEAWHLRSGPDAKDGKHVISIDGATLSPAVGAKDAEALWEKDYFPFAFLRFSERLLGFGGQSLAERLTGRQLEINRTLTAISETLRRKGRGRWFVPKGSRVLASKLTNGLMDIVEYSGQLPPQHDNAPVLSVEDINYLRMIWTDGFEESGLSQLSASAKNPFGADASGAAIREYNDVESERFVMVGKAYEQLFLDATGIGIDMVKDASEESGDEYEVAYPEKKGVSRVKWSEIDLERDDYVIQMFPVSSLPQTPSARRAALRELVDDGVIDQAEYRQLLELPDLEASNSLALAAIDDVDATLYGILEGPEAKVWEHLLLDPMTNVELLISRGQSAYLRGKLNGAPEERLEKLRDLLMTAADALAAAEAGAQPAAPPGMPMGPEAGALPPGAPMPPDPLAAAMPMLPPGGPPSLQ